MAAKNNSLVGIVGIIATCSTGDKTAFTVLAFHIVLTILVIFGNILVVLVVWKNKSMWNTTNFFLANISCTDLLFALLTLPGYAYVILTSRSPFAVIEHLGPILNTSIFLECVSSAVVTITFSFLSIERYNALIHPMKLGRRLSKRSAKIVICATWLFSVTVVIPSFVINTPHAVAGLVIYQGATFFIYLAIPTFIVTFCYGKIIIGIYVVKNVCAHGNGTAQDIRDKKNLIKMLLIATSTFLIPKFLELSSYLSVKFGGLKTFGFFYWCWDLGGALGLVIRLQNPVVYAIYNQNYKKGMIRLVRHCRADQRSTSSSSRTASDLGNT